MQIHADFSQKVLITPDRYQWVASPQAGVERVMLDRIGEEQARATSIVRYAASSYFPVHHHPDGEEILVLSGIFSDQQQDYPAGWYLRNPDGSSHQPFSHQGAFIFVKLRQMSRDDRIVVRINTHLEEAWHMEQQHKICPLFQNDHEKVELRLLTQEDIWLTSPDLFTEILVLEGTIHDGEQYCPVGSWIRLPRHLAQKFTVISASAKLYIKTMPALTNINI